MGVMADTILHPLRLRIIQAFLGHSTRTTTDLQAMLPDVPPATLYRHVARLAQAGILKVVKTQQVRGATERTYTIDQGQLSLDPDDMRQLGKDGLRAAFLTFVASLVDAFDNYLERGDIDLARDLAGFRMVGFQATDEEFRAAIQRMNAPLVTLAMRNDVPAGARRRLLATITLPTERDHNDHGG